MNYKLSDIALHTEAQLRGEDRHVSRVTQDSRRTIDPAATLFVALRGTHRDGHQYIDELYRRGVRSFMVDHAMDLARYPEAGFLIVPQTLEALQRLAAYHRSTFRGRVVAITGSNGKTVTKEWIAQLCPPEVKMFRSPKSYNSQIGVPLSLLMIQGGEEFAVIEAGISRPGEMERLEAMIRPDIGMITNIGEAHQEHFVSHEAKTAEKCKLFRNTPVLLYNPADPMLRTMLPAWFPDRKLLGIKTSQYPIDRLPFPDSASHENAALAMGLFDALGYNLSSILPRIAKLQSVVMRLEQKEGINDCQIINDSYNTDINSLEIALEYLSTVARHPEKVLILSDIDQSGRTAEELYTEVARLVALNGITEVIGIGAEISQQEARFTAPKTFYPSTEHFLRSADRSRFARQSLLLKGGRRFGFERIERILEEQIHTTTLEVNLDHMIHNLNYFRGLLKPDQHLMVMVKASAYGHGTYEVARMLEQQGVDFLAVAFADEGVTLREAGITMPIVVLNADADSFDLMIEYRLDPEIYNFSSLEAFARAVQRRGEIEETPIHLKLDTGMHRLGFERPDIEALIPALKAHPELSIRTIFTHMAGSDEACHDDFTRGQIALFRELSDRLIAAFPDHKILRHIDNSAGIERFPEAQFDMVRLGIGLYGISFVHQESLLPVSTLRSRIVQIKTIPVGETVGYGRHGIVSEHPVHLATIPIGYADGLDRHLSCGRWSCRVRGKKAPIFGNICMDTCMIDITGIDAHEGDSVIVFGEGAPIVAMAEALDTIPYEIMTSISTRVKRIFTKE
ncbi:MAG: alanine racemase [Alistipes sp.]|nr:alanine racemase [Alistipes sp.]